MSNTVMELWGKGNKLISAHRLDDGKYYIRVADCDDAEELIGQDKPVDEASLRNSYILPATYSSDAEVEAAMLTLATGKPMKESGSFKREQLSRTIQEAFKCDPDFRKLVLRDTSGELLLVVQENPEVLVSEFFEEMGRAKIAHERSGQRGS